jgi:uncharacterized protein YkwD
MGEKLLNKSGMSFFAILIILLSLPLSCATPQPGRSSGLPERKSKPVITIGKLEKAIHALINRERERNGLAPLAWDDALADIARKHSQDMAKRNYFDHYSPEGRDYFYRYLQEGYQCAVREGRIIHQGAENIALNHLYDSFTTINGDAYYDWNSQDKLAESTVQGWMKSPGHRKNILTPYFRKEGIGVVISPDDKVYITENFC